MNQIIINNSSEDGRDRFHNTPLGFTFRFINLEKNLQNKIICLNENWKNKKKNLVFCSIRQHTDKYRRGNSSVNRQKILITLKKNNINNEELEINNYFKKMLNSKFVISPEGNGIDAHRNYEAFFCGCIPIIEDNKLMREKYKELPILWTKDYSEITQDYLEKKYIEIQNKSYNFKKLYLDFYNENTQIEIKKRCNFWINKKLNINNFYS